MVALPVLIRNVVQICIVHSNISLGLVGKVSDGLCNLANL